MAVRFILGRSGTGKTSHCINSIVAALLQGGDQPLILLVPEQATYQAERAILANEQIAGYNRLHVLSFDRLQYKLLGRTTARPQISRLGRQMIIHRILRNCRDRLRVFGQAADSIGLAARMAETISELHRYANSIEDLDAFVEAVAKDAPDTRTAMKFADIAIVLKKYLEFATEKFVDPEVQLNAVCRAAAAADFTRSARVWVDGFSGFPTGELALLAELLKVSAEADIALCLDPSEFDPDHPEARPPDQADIFYPTRRTYADLLAMVRSCHIKMSEPLLLSRPYRFSACPALAHVEKSIFTTGLRPVDGAEGIRTTAAANARAEVRFVASEIRRLVRAGSLRYRDIAVIASDLRGYQHYVIACFEDLDLPFFIDRRTPLSSHPAALLALSALRTVLGGFAHADIFACLKTDLFGLDCDDIDLIENYCIEFGLAAGHWQGESDWQFCDPGDNRYDLSRINRIRKSIAEPLRQLSADLQAESITAEKFTTAVFAFLERLDLVGSLDSWIETARNNSDFAAVEEHRQFYDRFVGVFDELCEVFAGCELSPDDLSAILTAALSQLTLALIPPTQDQILVGSVERSRHPDLKAVFLLGATQKQFPVPIPSVGILTDTDRHIAAEADFELAGDSSDSLAERRYLAYIAFTRPSDRLFITYPLADEKGSAVVRSQFIDDIESLFVKPPTETFSGLATLEEVDCQSQLAESLCTTLGADSGLDDVALTSNAGKLLAAMTDDERLGELARDIRRSLAYENAATLDPDVASQFTGDQIRTSASRLGTFAACPYKYFANYCLKLEKRRRFKLEPLDLGTFYHDVLDMLFKQFLADGVDITELDETRLNERLQVAIDSHIAANAFLANFIARNDHNGYIVTNASQNLRDCLADVAAMIKAGQFRPLLTEVAFGRGKNATRSIGRLRLDLSDGRAVCLDGKIDRLDTCPTPETGAIAAVFDYKRTNKTFKWSHFYHGIDLQLPIYLLAATDADSSDVDAVAGAFFIQIEVPPNKPDIKMSADDRRKPQRKARGVFNGDFAELLEGDVSRFSRFYSFQVVKDGHPYGNYRVGDALKPKDFAAMIEHARKTIADLVETLISGVITVNPYRLGGQSPCSWCDYRPVCRFDWQVNDYKALDSKNKLEVIEAIGGCDD